MYTGDNLGSIQCLNTMGGNTEDFEEIKQLHISAAACEVHLGFEWQSRAAEDLKMADTLSSTQDCSRFNLSHSCFQSVCRRKLPGSQGAWGFPTCDVFAGPNKDEHKAAL